MRGGRDCAAWTTSSTSPSGWPCSAPSRWAPRCSSACARGRREHALDAGAGAGGAHAALPARRALPAGATGMSAAGVTQTLLYLLLVLLAAGPCAWLMMRALAGRRVPTSFLERPVWKLTRIDPAREMGWVEYAKAVL